MEVVLKLKPWDAANIKVVKAEDLVKFVNLHQEVVLRRLAIQNAAPGLIRTYGDLQIAAGEDLANTGSLRERKIG